MSNKPDDSEVRAAVKRWRGVDLHYMPVYPGGQKQFDLDAQTLAMAYLALTPADSEEPIDFDNKDGWLQSVGCGDPTINGWPILFENGGCDPIEVWLDYEGCVALIQSNTDDHVLIGTKIKTRGQFRDFCRVLGIPLSGEVK